ncbi:MAG: phytanoyl-CoA dioxygenase family protein [Caldilineaceae bacterium]
MPTEMQDYLFDLRGYVMLEGALNKAHVDQLNADIDALLPMAPGEWKGHVHRHDSGKGNQLHLQNIYENGAAFERLIDHPAWINHINRYVGGDDGLFIDEAFLIQQGPGPGQQFHSGGHKRKIRTQFRFHNNEFRCGQVNVLIALTDIGPGDGPTMVIPGSHKSNLMHPVYKLQDRRLGEVEVKEAAPVHYKAGDALVFVDCLAHAGGARVNPGYRRVLVIRYGPHWGHNRYGYRPSAELLARLTPAQRQILQPIPPFLPPG